MQKREERPRGPVWHLLLPLFCFCFSSNFTSTGTSPRPPRIFFSFFFFPFSWEKTRAKTKKSEKKGTKVTFNPFQSRDASHYTVHSLFNSAPLPRPKIITNWLAVSYWLKRFKKAGESPSSGTPIRSSGFTPANEASLPIHLLHTPFSNSTPDPFEFVADFPLSVSRGNHVNLLPLEIYTIYPFLPVTTFEHRTCKNCLVCISSLERKFQAPASDFF